MKLYAHSDKFPNIGNLQDAYKQISTIEAQEKMSQEERDRSMIVGFRKTGNRATLTAEIVAELYRAREFYYGKGNNQYSIVSNETTLSI